MGQAKQRQHHSDRPASIEEGGVGSGGSVGSLKLNLGVAVLLTVLGLIAYHNAFLSPFIWDDPYLVTDNYLITSFKFLPDAFATSTVRWSPLCTWSITRSGG